MDRKKIDKKTINNNNINIFIIMSNIQNRISIKCAILGCVSAGKST